MSAEVSWDIKLASGFGDTKPPTEEELRIFREKVDMQGFWSRGRHRMIREEED